MFLQIFPEKVSIIIISYFSDKSRTRTQDKPVPEIAFPAEPPVARCVFIWLKYSLIFM